jgi:hypothetical protein
MSGLRYRGSGGTVVSEEPPISLCVYCNVDSVSENISDGMSGDNSVVLAMLSRHVFTPSLPLLDVPMAVTELDSV